MKHRIDYTRHLKLIHGFTLIELLVVISIIALLMSIMMPSLNKAKGAARSVVCASNLRQFGLATHTYIAMNNDVLPLAMERWIQSPLIDPKGEDEGRGWYWAGLLYESGGFGLESFRCPADHKRRFTIDESFLWVPRPQEPAPEEERISYGAVMINYRESRIPWSVPEDSIFVASKMRMSGVRNPSAKYTIWDSHMAVFTQTQPYSHVLSGFSVFLKNPNYRLDVFENFFRHNMTNLSHSTMDNRGPNMLVLDGHVQRTVNIFSLTNSNFAW